MNLQLREKQNLLDKLPLMGDPDSSPINKCQPNASLALTSLVSCREADLIGDLLPIAIGNPVSLSQSTDALNPKLPRLNYTGVWVSACGVVTRLAQVACIVA